MPQENQNPVPTPQPGQATGNQQNVGSQPPAAVDKTKPSGGETQQAGKTVTLSQDEINDIKRKAGRWDAYLKRSREDRRKNRSASKSSYDTDNTDPNILEAIKERDDKIGELSSVNTKLKVKDQVRDMIESEEYKDLPKAIKHAIIRNPLGFANSESQTVDDAVADIRDYLDDELDNLASIPAPQGNTNLHGNVPAGTNGTTQTPPVSGSGPSSPNMSPKDGIEGKSGSDRSTAVLNNLLKNRGG